jgi:hypothetical protein
MVSECIHDGHRNRDQSRCSIEKDAVRVDERLHSPSQEFANDRHGRKISEIFPRNGWSNLVEMWLGD